MELNAHNSGAQATPASDDVCRVERHEAVRLDQHGVGCHDRYVGGSDLGEECVDVRAAPESGAGSRCLPHSVGAPVVAALTGNELISPPTVGALLVEVGDRLALQPVRKVELAVGSRASQPLLDGT